MLQENITIHNSQYITRSEALRLGDFIYLSGILAAPDSNHPFTGTFDEEVKQAFNNVGNLLKQCGLNYSHIMKLSIQMTDLNQIKEVDAIIRQLFKDPYPACTITGVSALCSHAHIQIDGIAVDTRALEVLCACDGEEDSCDDKCCTIRK